MNCWSRLQTIEGKSGLGEFFSLIHVHSILLKEFNPYLLKEALETIREAG